MKRQSVTSALLAASLAACTCENPCPERFSIGTWCLTHSGCTVDGTACSDDCRIFSGRTLSVPLSSFRSELGSRDEVFVVLASQNPPIQGVEVSIDGIAGLPSSLSEIAQSYSFESLAGEALEVGYAPQSDETSEIDLYFHDFECEKEHDGELLCPE